MIANTYSEQEWTALTEAPFLAGTTVSALDLGVVSVVKEMAAMIEVITSAKKNYPSNQLIAAVITEIESRDPETAPEPSSEKDLNVLLAELGRVASIVDAKASADEARGFKTFLYEVSEKTANASGSGFLGFGDKLSDKEKDFLARLRTTLNLATS